MTGRLSSAKSSTHRGWYSRGYLPHRDTPDLLQAITFRLADSLPGKQLRKWEEELRDQPESRRGKALRERVDRWLDAGRGHCALRDPRLTDSVEQSLLRFDGERYRLLAWVVMPNHVHVVIQPLPGHRLDAIVQSWKIFSAKQCNRLLRRTGAFWHPDYFDRFMRDGEHFLQTVRYIHANPVKAGLVKRPQDWRYSSDWKGWERDPEAMPPAPKSPA